MLEARIGVEIASYACEGERRGVKAGAEDMVKLRALRTQRAYALLQRLRTHCTTSSQTLQRATREWAMQIARDAQASANYDITT